MSETGKENVNQYKEQREEKRRRKRGIIIVAAAAVCCILLLTVFVNALFNEGIRKGITVNGINVSGLSEAKAMEKVEAEFDNMYADMTVTLLFGDTEKVYTVSDLVTEFKTKEAVKKAYETGRKSWVLPNLFKTMSVRLGGENINAEPVLNEPALAEYFSTIMAVVENPVVENSYIMSENSLKLTNGKTGNSIDVEAARRQIIEMLESGISGSINIIPQEKQPDAFDVNKIYDEIAHAPQNAQMKEENGKKYIVEAKNGFDFDKEQLSKLIEDNKANEEPYYLELEVIAPEITEVDMSSLFEETLSSYTSKITDSNADRLSNVRLAAEKINGVILNPDEEFRYLAHVEPITPAGGYKMANVYSNGRVERGIGGGVCQVSSALYSAVLYADLEVTRRYNHSLTVQYVPLGMDATVSSGELDFRFRNNTNEPVMITTSFSYSGIGVTILGKKPNPDVEIEIENVTAQTLDYEVIETEDPELEAGEVVTDVTGKTGYVINTYKHYYKDGQLIKTDYVGRSSYRKVNAEKRRGPEVAEVSGETVTEEGEEAAASPTPGQAETPKPEATPEATPEPTGTPESE